MLLRHPFLSYEKKCFIQKNVLFSSTKSKQHEARTIAVVGERVRKRRAAGGVVLAFLERRQGWRAGGGEILEQFGTFRH